MILNVAKGIIVCIRPIHRKSEGSSHDIPYIKTEVMLTGFTSCMHKFKLQFLPYSSPFFYLAFDNKSLKGEQSDSGTLLYDEQQAAGN